MDLSHIKLVVTDMDGTLLNSKHEVSPEFFELYQQLKAQNINFAAASGRQYHSIQEKLDPIKDEISIIAENGGITTHGDYQLEGAQLNLNLVRALIPRLREMDTAKLVICTKDCAYIESKDPEFISFFKNFYASFKQVDDLTAVEGAVCKIACYHKNQTKADVEHALGKLKDKLQIKVSGEHWFDLAHKDAHKGNAVKGLQNYLNIKPGETLVFGDYNNDLEMMLNAGCSVAMKNAHESIKNIATHHTESNDENGVEKILQKLIDQRKLC